MFEVCTIVQPTRIMKIREQSYNKRIHFRSYQQLSIPVNPVPMAYAVQ